MVVKVLRPPAQLPPRPLSHVRSSASICTGDKAASHIHPPETPSPTQRPKQAELLPAGSSTQLTRSSGEKQSAGFGTTEQRGIVRVVCIQHEVIIVQIAGAQMVQGVLKTQTQRRGEPVIMDVLISAAIIILLFSILIIILVNFPFVQ